MADAPDPGLKIGPRDTTIAFIQQLTIGLHHYVLARAALHASYNRPALMLSQQAIELLIKAIHRLENETPPNDHQLIRLIKNVKAPAPAYFEEILADGPKYEFLQLLSDAYLEPRYGEAGLEIRSGAILQNLDEIVFCLRKTWAEKIKWTRTPQIYVPVWLREPFLRDNRHFGSDDVTDNFMAVLLPLA